MRLLQIDSDGELSLTTYCTANIPSYAILSHTWGADYQEVTFADLIGGRSKSKDGYFKVHFCGEQARKDDLQYFWVDTCCIDKSSSTELQEAFNSMFRWYNNATRCYVYLSDVSTVVDTTYDQETEDHIRSALRRSRWFRRGWTLQELIAPTSVEFFSREGNRLGSKRSLAEDIHDITGISLEVLRGRSIAEVTVEERMSWTKDRETSRPEDKAYSLMGIFNVFMPLLYGEGRENAFIRLRNKIVKSSNRISNAPNGNSPCTEVNKASPVITRRLPAAAEEVSELHQVILNARCRSNVTLDLLLELLQELHNLAQDSDGKCPCCQIGSAGYRAPMIAPQMSDLCTCFQKDDERHSSEVSTPQTLHGTRSARYALSETEDAFRPQVKAWGCVFSKFMESGAFAVLCRHVRTVWKNLWRGRNVYPSQFILTEPKHCVLGVIIIAMVYQDPYMKRLVHAFFAQPYQGPVSMTLLLFVTALAGHFLPQLPAQIPLLAGNSLSIEDAFGDRVRIPLMYWEHYETFHAFLEIGFRDRPGHDLVAEKSYRLLIGGMRGQVLDTAKWPHIINSHKPIKLTMAMVLNMGDEYHRCTNCKSWLARRSYQMFICESCTKPYPTVEALFHHGVSADYSAIDVVPHGQQQRESSEPVPSAPVQTCAPCPLHQEFRESQPLQDGTNRFVNTMFTVEGSTPFHQSMTATVHRLIQRFQLRSNKSYALRCSDLDPGIPEEVMEIISNLFCLEKSSLYIDYLLSQVDRQYFLDNLVASLRPRIISRPHQREFKTVAVVPVPAGAIEVVISILINIATSTPKYRDLLVNHTAMMREVMHCAQSHSVYVRGNVCMLVSHLIDETDPPNEQTDRMRRIGQLRRIGVMDSMSILLHDPDLNIRKWAYKPYALLRQSGGRDEGLNLSPSRPTTIL
ncbi:hypothetical protein LTR10_011520 [Elasticomyces elasticus]|uniref:Heterokaryon incompatibility domain-containing protein n=1 Tax=Exophiala sideris TaxID=1016849 RepID=A0ABR0JDH0_9EURO|nr:hypothetical protein LTR10_011520 [Elasticomyces elasticus]KAK5032022.1 hypothetical protein LTS07_004644 [Exophiala sideris]KAK5040951.1 hypothetical protein LTR13_003253 [Exophiala sideris]KAK5061715.1 hypothetical protein LTR69_004897 [Exophiala sideris]KAK5184415.1 hypothetical protein LTR44_003088 [Eurotiomycetes sp. CCFEE 6388]